MPSHSFRVHASKSRYTGATFEDVESYLYTLHRRLHNAMHAQTRVFTYTTWRPISVAGVSYKLHWNDDGIPGERLLGSFGWVVEKELVEQIKAEFARGAAVHLFTFNSDADLIFQEVLVPEVPVEPDP